MALSAQEFAFVCGLVRRESAIVLGPGKEYLVETRLLPLARRAGTATVSEFVARAQQRPDPDANRGIVEALTTNETSWFRDQEPFTVLRDVVLPELKATRPGPQSLRIWSAACSSGQETYSLALTLQQAIPPRWSYQILGSDISTEMLQRAQAGRYSQLEINRGLPAALGYRGVLAGAFFGADTYVPFTLTQVHGYGAAAAGVPLVAGALGWFAGSWWQARRADPARYRLVRAGCALISLSAAGLVLVAWPGPPGWLAAPLWVFAGFGMGISMASISVLMLRLSPEGERGANGAALQICDVLASATLVGLGGVLLTAAVGHRGGVSFGLTLIDLVMAAVAAAGVVLAGRLRA